ncbi:MAG TPA: U32 family peptidase, partial [Bacteroidales bacterium]|nr:U32 family peptidase [Bacteroidales bacterium]
GYYLGRKLGEWNDRYGSAATKRKIYIGKVTNYFSKAGVAEIKLENGDLESGDTLLVTGPTTGAVDFVAEEIRVDLKESVKALKGEFCSVKTPVILRRSDKVYRWVNHGDPQ